MDRGKILSLLGLLYMDNPVSHGESRDIQKVVVEGTGSRSLKVNGNKSMVKVLLGEEEISEYEIRSDGK